MAEAPFIEVDGVGVHVEAEGLVDGTPVVFLHGVGSSGKTWEWLPDSVTGGRWIVRLDLRGHGRSDHTPGMYHLARYGEDVVAALRALASPRSAVLVGHSLGGVVAWWVAQKHPELVAGALLEDPPLLAGETPESEAGRFRTVFHTVKATILANRERGLSEEDMAERLRAVRWTPGTPTLGTLLTDDALAALAFGYSRLDIGVIDGAIDGSTLATTDTRSPVVPPVVIVAGDDAAGAAFSSEDADRLLGSQPGVEVFRVAGAGHRIHEARQHRDAFVEHLSEFLDTHRC